MTIDCVKCKKEAIPGDRSRSFHKFPDDHALREKWMKSLGITKVTKYTKLCSDHFTPNAFVDSDGYTSIRRLRPEVISSISAEQIECVKNSFTENQTQTDGQKQQCASMVDGNGAADLLCSNSNEFAVDSIGVVNKDKIECSKSDSLQKLDLRPSMECDTSKIIPNSCFDNPMKNLSTDLLPEEVIGLTPCGKLDSSMSVESDTSTLLSESYANTLRRSGSTELSHNQLMEPTGLGKTKSNGEHTNLKRSLSLCDITYVSPNKKLCSPNISKSSVLQMNSRGSQSNILCGSMKRNLPDSNDPYVSQSKKLCSSNVFTLSLSRDVLNESTEARSNIKRHMSTIDISHIPATKKFRFYDGPQPMHLSREDFATDEAWFRFLKYTI